jgi:alcohol dehydrogenase
MGFGRIFTESAVWENRLMDLASMLLKVVRSGKLQPKRLVTHRVAMNDIMKAYDTFGNAAKERALKVILTTGEAH